MDNKALCAACGKAMVHMACMTKQNMRSLKAGSY